MNEASDSQFYPGWYEDDLGAHFHTWDDHGLICAICTPEQKARLEQLARDMARDRPASLEDARAALDRASSSADGAPLEAPPASSTSGESA